MNLTVYMTSQLAKRVKQDNAFVTRVHHQPKIWLIGEDESLLAYTSLESQRSGTGASTERLVEDLVTATKAVAAALDNKLKV